VAQTLFLPIEQVFSNLGVIGAGYKLYTYETGTSTPLATYSDTALSVANANPTIADSSGRFIQIFIGDAKLYKAVLKDADDNTIWTADPIDPKTFSLNDFDPRPTSFWGTTAGTSSAYTLVADPIVTSYSDKQVFFLDFHTACAAGPTLTYVNGGSALNLHKPDGAGGTVALEANDVLTGTYEARNNGTNVVILNPEIQEKVNANSLIIPINNELTIASGAITITDSRHTVDTESDASTDDLDTINGGTSGKILILSSANDARDIVIKHGADNIITDTQTDITLGLTNDKIVLEYDGSNWVVISRSVNNDFLSSKVADGYTYLPNGLIMQWGDTGSISGGGTSSITFPLEFPNSVLNIICSIGGTPSPDNGAYSPYPTSIATTGFTMNNGDGDSAYTTYWTAIGK